jgi:hypothetical protein
VSDYARLTTADETLLRSQFVASGRSTAWDL